MPENFVRLAENGGSGLCPIERSRTERVGGAKKRNFETTLFSSPAPSKRPERPPGGAEARVEQNGNDGTVA